MVDWLEVGARVKVLRMEKGWSLRQLGEKAGVAHSYIANLEAGTKTRPSLEHVNKLAVALGRSVDDLMGDSFEAPDIVDVDPGEELQVNLLRIGELQRELSPKSVRQLAAVVKAVKEEAERDWRAEQKSGRGATE